MSTRRRAKWCSPERRQLARNAGLRLGKYRSDERQADVRMDHVVRPQLGLSGTQLLVSGETRDDRA
jgi:hypothetical protein